MYMAVERQRDIKEGEYYLYCSDGVDHLTAVDMIWNFDAFGGFSAYRTAECIDSLTKEIRVLHLDNVDIYTISLFASVSAVF